MLELPGLLLDQNYLGAVTLLGIFAVGVLICLALARWLGFKPGPRLIPAALALVETWWQSQAYSRSFLRCDWVLFPAWHLPVLVSTGVVILLLVLRSSLPESSLPLRGKWLTQLLVGVGISGMLAAGPCSRPLRYNAEILRVLPAPPFTHDLLPSFPLPWWYALGLWLSLLLGVPYLLLTHWALLESVHLVVERRVAPRIALRFRQAGIATATYGKALSRNDSLW